MQLVEAQTTAQNIGIGSLSVIAQNVGTHASSVGTHQAWVVAVLLFEVKHVLMQVINADIEWISSMLSCSDIAAVRVAPADRWPVAI